jgi:hypothetical protein
VTFALTRIECYGVEHDEAVQKRFIQRAVLTITAANTDVDLDLGDLTSPGTFWAAADATATGLAGLAAFRAIAVAARSFVRVGGTGIADKAQADASIVTVGSLTSAATAGGNRTQTLTVTGLAASDTILAVTPSVEGDTKAQVLYYESGALSGGAANETATVTGLAATDNIIAVSQSVKNGTDTVALTGWSDQGSNSLKLYFTANPGAGGKVRVAVQRAGGVGVSAWDTPGSNSLSVTFTDAPGTGTKVTVVYSRAVTSVVAGTYQLSLDGTYTQMPNILFCSGDAPTAYTIVCEWELKDDQLPIQLVAAA